MIAVSKIDVKTKQKLEGKHTKNHKLNPGRKNWERREREEGGEEV